PLFAPFEGNASASVSSFFPQNICLGDILKNSGYQNYFVQGANPTLVPPPDPQARQKQLAQRASGNAGKVVQTAKLFQDIHPEERL
ncbi:hypothetical protein MJI12_26655, partial [Salmonella enterica subsp. enterica serovar Kentucky]|nr:hypothetical protein [Salmonella enterica subsp. enterica serovar Kentucky]